MKPYELTYIVSSGIASEQADTIKKDLETFVQDHQGVIVTSKKTAPQILAYPVKKQTSAYFVTLEFQAEESTIKELSEKIKKEANILRHAIVVKRPVKQKKQRRSKRPALVEARPGHTAPSTFSTKPETPVKAKKVELEDIDKKLEEILSE